MKKLLDQLRIPDNKIFTDIVAGISNGITGSSAGSGSSSRDSMLGSGGGNGVGNGVGNGNANGGPGARSLRVRNSAPTYSLRELFRQQDSQVHQSTRRNRHAVNGGIGEPLPRVVVLNRSSRHFLIKIRYRSVQPKRLAIRPRPARPARPARPVRQKIVVEGIDSADATAYLDSSSAYADALDGVGDEGNYYTQEHQHNRNELPPDPFADLPYKGCLGSRNAS